MQAKTPHRRRALILLAAWIVLHSLSHLSWSLRAETIVAESDTIWFQVYALELYQMVAGDLDVPGIRVPEGVSGVFAALGMQSNESALYHLLIAGSYALFGVSVQSALLVANLFLVLLLIGMYLLGERLGGPRAGLLAAVFTGVLPGVLGSARTLDLYHPIAALLPYLFWLMLLTDRFRRAGPATALGVLTGVAILVKGQILVFAGVPMAVWFVSGIAVSKREGHSARHVIANGVLFAACALIVSAPWWAPNLRFLVRDLIQHTAGAYIAGTGLIDEPVLPYASKLAPWTLAWAAYYARVALDCLTPLYALLAVAGVAFVVVRRKSGALLIALWIAVPYAFYTLISGNHHPLYYFPALGGFALAAALAADAWPRALRAATVAVTVLFFFIAVWPVAAGFPNLSPSTQGWIEGGNFFRAPESAPHEADGAAVDKILGKRPGGGWQYVGWLMPDEVAEGSDKAYLAFELMRRSDRRLIDYALPTRTDRSPITSAEFPRRVNTWIVWDTVTPIAVPEARDFSWDHGPAAIDETGTPASLASNWKPAWLDTVRGTTFLGAVRLEQGRIVVWCFASPLQNPN